MKAKDVMSREVIVVEPQMTVRELAQLFIDRGISGAPVIDGGGRILGVVTQTDIVRRDREKTHPVEVPGYYREGDQTIYMRGYKIEEPEMTRIEEVMTPVVISADEETSLDELASIMLRKHIHRIIITRAGQLSGIVTSLDLLRGFANLASVNKSAKK